MLLIVESDVVHEHSGSNDRGPYTIRRQEARVKGEILAGPITITLGDDKPYPVGEYEIDFERSVQFGRYGRLEITTRIATKKPAAKGFGAR